LISQGKVTGAGSSAKRPACNLTLTLLKLAARGSLKTKPILLTIAILIAINVGLHTMTNSYEKEVTTLMALYAGREYLTVSDKPIPGSIKVAISPYSINDRRILLVSSDNIKTLLAVSDAMIDGVLPVKADEVAMGESIEDFAERNAVTVYGRPLKVTGYVKSSDHLAYSIISPTQISPTAQPLYLLPREGGDAEASAPAIKLVTRSLFLEVLSIMSGMKYLLYATLALSCLFQGYNSLIEAEHVLQVFASMSTPRRIMNASIFLYACVISIGGAVLGFSVGVFTPGLLSSLTSIFLRLPPLKPLIDLKVGDDLALGVGASLPTLFIGLMRGYSRHIASD